MKFFAGFISAFVMSVLISFLVIVSGAYNVAATVPHTQLERVILNSTMLHSVRAHAGKELREVWSEEQVRKGFEEYDEMCIICHAAPGKAPTDIRQGLQPNPPNLAETSQQWSGAELFWIIKNGIKMTGMPAFGPTHQDEQIWNIVSFVRCLPKISAQEFKAMEEQLGKSPQREQGHYHH